MTAPPVSSYPPIRVMLVDDHPFVRMAVSALVRDTDGMEVAGECADGIQAPSLAMAVHPDVVLMDIKMPTSGIETTRLLVLQQPRIRVLMLTSSVRPDDIARAREAGAVGFLVKGGGPERLVKAIRRAAAGESIWPDAAAAASRA